MKSYGKICPICNKSCRSNRCVWWNDADKICAICKIAKNIDIMTGNYYPEDFVELLSSDEMERYAEQ